MHRNKFSSFSMFIILLLALAGCVNFDSAVNHVKVQSAEEKGFSAYQAKDYNNAFAYFQTAAELGGGVAQFMLAKMYLSGEGVEPSRKQYLHWMQKSAGNGFPPAYNLIGISCLSENPDKAIDYFKKAAEKEHDASMYMLGLMYANGTGVEANATEALRWFRMAHAQGFSVENEFLSRPELQSYIEKVRKTAITPVAEESTKRLISTPPKEITSRPSKVQTSAPPKVLTSVAPKMKTSVSSKTLPRTTSNTITPALTKQEMVRAIQTSLIQLGYDPGPVDGFYGNKTQRAVEDFQRQAGIEVDGRATFKLLGKLKAAR